MMHILKSFLFICTSEIMLSHLVSTTNHIFVNPFELKSCLIFLFLKVRKSQEMSNLYLYTLHAQMISKFFLPLSVHTYNLCKMTHNRSPYMPLHDDLRVFEFEASPITSRDRTSIRFLEEDYRRSRP